MFLRNNEKGLEPIEQKIDNSIINRHDLNIRNIMKFFKRTMDNFMLNQKKFFSVYLKSFSRYQRLNKRIRSTILYLEKGAVNLWEFSRENS